MSLDIAERWADIDKLLSRSGPSAAVGFEPDTPDNGAVSIDENLLNLSNTHKFNFKDHNSLEILYDVLKWKIYY